TRQHVQKVLGKDSFQTYEWYMLGAQRCLPVARIGTQATIGLGTGFILDGEHLGAELKDKLLLLTNSHVISNEETDRDALRPNESVIIFEVLGVQGALEVSDIIFTSPMNDLDVTILTFKPADEARIKEALAQKEVQLFKLSNEVPPPDTGRVYIIGHPDKGTMQLSLQDNALLDFDDRRMHYRTPTAGGSSGSPIFNGKWQLIGIHHGGGQLRKLNGEGTHNANEGIRMRAIIEKFRRLMKNEGNADH
ncbi:MAG: serine protease, partial [Chitinophagaceae bacterium]